MTNQSKTKSENWKGVPDDGMPTTHFIWDHKLKTHVRAEVDSPRPLKIENEWFRTYYKEQLALAASTRDALLAVLGELNHLRYRNVDKDAPVELSSIVLRSLGFHASDKARALKELEKAGWITVERRDRKSPLVTFCPKFRR